MKFYYPHLICSILLSGVIALVSCDLPVIEPTFFTFHRTFDNTASSEYGFGIIQALDKGYIISTNQGLLKTDSSGKEKWRRPLSNLNGEDLKVVQAENGDIYVAYVTETGSPSKKKIKLLRLSNLTGAIQGSAQTINSAGTEDDYLGDLIINRSKQLILYGCFYNNNSTSSIKWELKLFRLDQNLVAAPVSIQTVPDAISVSNANLIQASDGNYIGEEIIFLSSPIYFSLLITSSSTKYKWRESFSDLGSITDVIQLPSGGIFYSGRKKASTPHLSRHSLGSGVIENTRDYNFPASYFKGMVVSREDEIVACGTGDVFLTKINPQSLEVIWRKPSTDFFNAQAEAIANTYDGGYIVVGSLTNGSDKDVFLVKTNPKGEL